EARSRPSSERTPPPTPAASRLHHCPVRSRGRATLVPPQTLFCAAHARGRPFGACADTVAPGKRAVPPWSTRANPRRERDTCPAGTFFAGTAADGRAGVVGRVHAPEVYRRLSPGTPCHFLSLPRCAVQRHRRCPGGSGTAASGSLYYFARGRTRDRRHHTQEHHMKSITIDRSKRLKDEPQTGHNRWHPDIPAIL